MVSSRKLTPTFEILVAIGLPTFGEELVSLIRPHVASISTQLSSSRLRVNTSLVFAFIARPRWGARSQKKNSSYMVITMIENLMAKKATKCFTGIQIDLLPIQNYIFL